MEIGELANEWRGFKFWSKDQEPRSKEPLTARGKPYYNPLLEEYADVLHFICNYKTVIENDKEIKFLGTSLAQMDGGEVARKVLDFSRNYGELDEWTIDIDKETV